jgi:alanine-glyoxylate transaminase/serine-glyoxylate transaminase/serine-pyruvate transaminase
MIPGPVQVSDEVLGAVGSPVMPHYGPRWVQIYRETQDKLRQVFRTEGNVYIMPGSGSAGLDAALGSLLEPGDRCLVPVNGFFGDRLAKIARSRGAQVIEVQGEWGQPVSPEAVRTALQQQSDFQALCIVHHETSTGVLNPIKDLGELARAYGIPYVVDAISSLGGEELPMDDWGIDVCVSASQKCLESPPGLALVAVGTGGWRAIDRKKGAHSGWYLNLRTWREYEQSWGDWHPYPVTLPTNLILALNVALKHLLEETLEGRVKRYARVAQILRSELKKREFTMLVEEAWASSAVTAAKPPARVSPDQLVAYLKEKHHIHIAGGLGELKGEIIRIGHMGQAAGEKAVVQLMAALDEFLKVEGFLRWGPAQTSGHALPHGDAAATDGGRLKVEGGELTLDD